MYFKNHLQGGGGPFAIHSGPGILGKSLNFEGGFFQDGISWVDFWFKFSRIVMEMSLSFEIYFFRTGFLFRKTRFFELSTYFIEKSLNFGLYFLRTGFHRRSKRVMEFFLKYLKYFFLRVIGSLKRGITPPPSWDKGRMEKTS